MINSFFLSCLIVYEFVRTAGKYLTPKQKIAKQRAQASLELLKQQGLIKIGSDKKEDDDEDEDNKLKANELTDLVELEDGRISDEEENDKQDEEQVDEESDEESDEETEEEEETAESWEDWEDKGECLRE